MRTRRDDANSTVILREHPEVRLRERLEYGDGGDPHQASGEREDARAKNQLARLHRHYDEAGLLIFESYDFKGNILEKTRQVISDRALLRVFDTRTDGWHVEGSGVAWPSDQRSLQAYAEAVLDSDIYRTSFTYDASNRVQTMQYPDDADRGRKLLRERYSRSGALQGVDIDGATFVEHIAYNARGQRTLIAYGNRVMTRYAYDPSTLRLSRLRTERYAPPDGLSFNPAGTVFQDFAYTYDITGNLLNIADITPRCGVRNNPDSARAVYGPLAPLLVTGDALVRRFKYDPLYRLVFATGRECRNTRRPRPWPEFTASHHPWPDDPSCGFNASSHADQDNAPNLTALYEEEYYYDPAGNMLRLKHSRRLNHSNSGDSWTRHFGMGGLTPEQWNQEWAGHLGIDWPNAPGNQATHVGNDLPRVSQSHFYDSSGNLVRENNERHFEWDHSDRLRVFRTQTRSSSGALSEPSVHVQYLYDSTGARVKKLARTSGGGYESTVYVDGIFEHQRWEHNGQASGQNSHLHVMDDQKRIAIVRVGEQHPDDRGPEIQYHLADHLSSSNLVIDAAGGWINREEFAPHGEAIFGSFSKKRYRFSGKERDEESGLYYHGARYYAPWLARWANCDPAGAGAGINVFSYVNNEPIRWRDPTGNNSEPPPWNIEIGPYKSGENPVEGHHIAQSAAYTEAPGEPDPYRNQALAISQKTQGGDVTPEVHKVWSKAQVLFNKGMAGRVEGKATVGKLTVESLGKGTLRGTGAIVPTSDTEEIKSRVVLQAGGMPFKQAAELARTAVEERDQLGSSPIRIPSFPKSFPSGGFIARDLLTAPVRLAGSVLKETFKSLIPGVELYDYAVIAGGGAIGGSTVRAGIWGARLIMMDAGPAVFTFAVEFAPLIALVPITMELHESVTDLSRATRDPHFSSLGGNPRSPLVETPLPSPAEIASIRRILGSGK